MAPKIISGDPEWFRTRRLAAANCLRALDNVSQAAIAIDRILADWKKLDTELKSALLYSSVIHYARPFCYRKDYGGKKLRSRPGFDSELHEHLVNLRNELIAHQDNETLRAIVGHGYCDLALSGTTTTALISTQCVVKALHRINNVDVAKRYASHFASCIAGFQEMMNEHLEAIHDMALE
jgi:hypothetical protein